MSNDKDLSRLGQGERLWVWRKQEGLTGHEAAARLGVGRGLFWEAEAGRRELPVAYPSIGRPGLPLLLRLARKRSGIGLVELAYRLSTTHPTLLLREREGDHGLRAWWEGRGWTFR